MNYKTLFRTFLLCLSSAGLSISLCGQPSGGPYGPIQQDYPLPKANRIFYVAPEGDPESKGSSLETPTTLENAIAQVVTGNAIVMRGGTYRTGNLLLNQGITIQPYRDEHPVVKGTRIATEWEKSGDGKWQTYWEALFPAEPADWWRREWGIRRTPLHLFNNDMVFVDGKLLGAVGSVEEVTEDTYHIDYELGALTIGVDPNDRTVEITAHNSAIKRTTRKVHGKENDRVGPTIRGITFTQYARLALEVEGVEPHEHMDPSNFGKEVVGTTFENLTISHCSRVAGYFRGDKLTIRNCLISDCGTEGIYVINSADVLLEKNIVTRTNSSENLSGYYASSIKIFNQSYNVVCRDNLVIDNPNASGVWYDVGNVDGIFVNNWVETTPNGFFFEISKGAICAGNVFVDCGTGVRILNSSDVEVYQNTFYDSTATFDRNGRSSEAGDHFGWHASAGPGVEERDGHVFKNNLLVASESYDRSLLRLSQRSDINDRVKTPHVSALDGNVYVRASSVSKEPLIHWSPAANESGILEFGQPSELNGTYPEFEENSVALLDYRGPIFPNPLLSRFELYKSFPESDAGTPLPDHIRKSLGWKKSRATFPGAYAPQ